jgi:hypothetical protein
MSEPRGISCSLKGLFVHGKKKKKYKRKEMGKKSIRNRREGRKKGQIPTAIHMGSYHILFLFY